MRCSMTPPQCHGRCCPPSTTFPPTGTCHATAPAQLSLGVRRFLASPVNDCQASCSQASPSSRRDSVRSLLPSVGGTLALQHHLRDYHIEAQSVRATHRRATRRRDASTAMARLALVRARASSRRSLVSRHCQFSPSLARSIVASSSLLGIGASHPVCRCHFPTSPDAVPMNPNRPKSPNKRCSEPLRLSRWLLPASAFPPPRSQRASLRGRYEVVRRHHARSLN